MSRKTLHIQRNQQGIVSIMMTVVMILVISLIVLGLAQISRREVRKSTDSQLSAQAFYAAESGVNDVVRLIHANGDVVTPKAGCNDNPAPYNTGLDPVIDSAANISYSCVIVEPNSDQVTGDFSTTPSVYSLATTAAGGLSSVTFTWGPGNGLSGDTSGCPTTALSSAANVNVFPTGGASGPWSCHYAVLRVDLTDASSLDRNTLVGNTRTFFFVPNRTGAVTSGNTDVRGSTCSSVASTCTATVSVPAGNAYYARIAGIYVDGTTTICANACDGAVRFADVATVDVTGKAQDVLRRIKVSVNLKGGNQNGAAGATIMSGDSICKRFKVNEDGTVSGNYSGYATCN